MKKTWVVVAESSRARFFLARTPRYDLEELAALSHAEGRLKDRDVRSDSPGRSFDSGGQGRHAMSEETSIKTQEQMAFAREIADLLDQGRSKGSYERLIICAPPEFLGCLRKTLPQTTKDLVDKAINKNLVRLSAQEIAGHMPGRL